MIFTPGTPGLIGGKVDDISKVDEKTQSMYRSGVGTLLYLTKHSELYAFSSLYIVCLYIIYLYLPPCYGGYLASLAKHICMRPI